MRRVKNVSSNMSGGQRRKPELTPTVGSCALLLAVVEGHVGWVQDSGKERSGVQKTTITGLLNWVYTLPVALLDLPGE